ncbi:MAG: tRNA 2-thiouridine(34) synthase MnmA [Fibrobacter sp.]|nr:tRNA 2-thiouridine(34) synthase MnmA [Fibrobacter sp.]
MLSKKRVVVGLSGGVDSALAAYLLKQQGYEVIGVTMATWDGSIKNMPHVEGREGCFGPGEVQTIAQAKSVANRLGIPHYVASVSEAYKSQVLDYFRAEYRAGRTPNPCVRCNQNVKFGALLAATRRMGVDFDYFATGHYARLDFKDSKQPFLYAALDDSKDQTYFLSRLTLEQLSSVIFPLGGMKKTDVRALAAEIGWVDFATKKESQDFLECGDYTVLFDESDNKPGDFVDMNGKVLGRHRGVIHYTIGQRKGLNIGGLPEPYFVVNIDVQKNQVVLGPRSVMNCVDVDAEELNLMVDEDSPLLQQPLTAHIRLGHKGALARITALDVAAGKISVHFDEPQFASAPGQILVLYADQGIVASGIIAPRNS